MAYIGEQATFLNTEILYISNTYNHPFTLSVEMHSTFVMVNESFSVERCSLQDEVRYTRPIFPFFSIVPFQAKGKEGNEDDGLKLMTDTQDPSFLLFTANSLNRIMRIWVRFKRHHR